MCVSLFGRWSWHLPLFAFILFYFIFLFSWSIRQFQVLGRHGTNHKKPKMENWDRARPDADKIREIWLTSLTVHL
jgi:hypothetical protein